ncbi:hypothetical protein [Nostoc sp. WHI]|uniref:hypothetical protein n=1 Tax=Nostoc sp. WHI TaxID=2650611 RepID=UPI0018C72D7F|nr:hypothetical protein [Nostoc sp. WHI]MBG1268707.1 hypothetical protein [Nostoc sp. WHI]
MKVHYFSALVGGILLALATPILTYGRTAVTVDENPTPVIVDENPTPVNDDGLDGGTDLNELPTELRQTAQELLNEISTKNDPFPNFPEGGGGSSNLNALPTELRQTAQELLNEILSRPSCETDTLTPGLTATQPELDATTLRSSISTSTCNILQL